MSRIGKMPISVPKGVDVQISGSAIKVKGKLGELTRTFHSDVSISRQDDQLSVTPRGGGGRRVGALWGLSRALLNNMILGVSQGFTKVLEVRGVGYRAQVQGDVLNLALGFSHPVNIDIPKGLDVQVDKNTVITVKGVDKEVVGQLCAEIRDIRPPEPYKGKGVRYVDEYVIQKVGKKK